MRIIPLSVEAANIVVKLWHRHSKPIIGFTYFSIGLEDDGKIIGAAIIGRPISWIWTSRGTAEVKRLVTNGTKNACSILYNAAWRAWKAQGGTRLLTYTKVEESGISLRAAGWTCMGNTEGVSLAPKGMYPYTTREQFERGEVEYLVRPRGKRNDSIYTGVKRRWLRSDVGYEPPNRKDGPGDETYESSMDLTTEEGIETIDDLEEQF